MNKMKKNKIKSNIKKLLNDPNYEFRFQMAGAWLNKPIIKCGICKEMVYGTVQTAYHKTEAGKSIGICSDCYQIMMEI
jgi:hypothetical protein